MECPKCRQEVRDGQRECPNCCATLTVSPGDAAATRAAVAPWRVAPGGAASLNLAEIRDHESSSRSSAPPESRERVRLGILGPASAGKSLFVSAAFLGLLMRPGKNRLHLGGAGRTDPGIDTIFRTRTALEDMVDDPTADWPHATQGLHKVSGTLALDRREYDVELLDCGGELQQHLFSTATLTDAHLEELQAYYNRCDALIFVLNPLKKSFGDDVIQIHNAVQGLRDRREAEQRYRKPAAIVLTRKLIVDAGGRTTASEFLCERFRTLLPTLEHFFDCACAFVDCVGPCREVEPLVDDGAADELAGAAVTPARYRPLRIEPRGCEAVLEHVVRSVSRHRRRALGRAARRSTSQAFRRALRVAVVFAVLAAGVWVWEFVWKVVPLRERVLFARRDDDAAAVQAAYEDAFWPFPGPYSLLDNARDWRRHAERRWLELKWGPLVSPEQCEATIERIAYATMLERAERADRLVDLTSWYTGFDPRRDWRRAALEKVSGLLEVIRERDARAANIEPAPYDRDVVARVVRLVEAELGVNVPGYLKERLLASNGGDAR